MHGLQKAGLPERHSFCREPLEQLLKIQYVREQMEILCISLQFIREQMEIWLIPCQLRLFFTLSLQFIREQMEILSKMLAVRTKMEFHLFANAL